MKNNTKSSITLPPAELKLVTFLMKQLGARSKVEVVRLGLTLLKDKIDRQALKRSFKEASLATRKSLQEELEELDHLSDEGLA